MLRRAQAEDLARIAQLRAAARRETPEQAAAWARDVIGYKDLLVLQQAPPAIDVVLALVPVYSGTRRGVWLAGAYAAPQADAAAARNFADAALRACAARGYTFAVAAPPGAAARQQYAELGFRPAFALRRMERVIPQNLWAQAEFDTVTVRRLQELRLHYRPGSVVFPEKTMAGILHRLYASGLTIVSTPRAYGLFYTAAEQMRFVELQADNDHSADILLQAARNHTGLTAATLFLAETQSLYLGQGKRCPYGMLRPLAKPFSTAEMYFRALL